MFWPGNVWREIEQDVKTSVIAGLKERGIDWANVDTHNLGRDVMLSGEAPSEEAKQQAIKIAADLVIDERRNTIARIVQWEGEIKPPVIPLSEGNIQLSAVEGKVSIAGVVASEEEKIQLIDAAGAQYGASNIYDQLVVGENIKPRDNFAGLISNFGLIDGVLRLRNERITVTGVVESEEIKKSIGQGLLDTLGEGYELSNRINVIPPKPVEPPPPPPPDPREICRAKVLDIMSDSKIYFGLSKSKIKQDSFPLLDRIAAVLSECPDSAIEVAGHTDATGSESYNVPLSQSRAQSVVDYLLEQGISAERLSFQGYGSAKPIRNNETEDGRAANRRIEFIVK